MTSSPIKNNHNHNHNHNHHTTKKRLVFPAVQKNCLPISQILDYFLPSSSTTIQEDKKIEIDPKTERLLVSLASLFRTGIYDMDIYIYIYII